MSKITAGYAAPLFELPGIDGETYSLADALVTGPVLAVFFKVSCPTSQFTFPFLQRLYETYGGGKMRFWAISQDDARDTRDFCAEFEIEFPALMDAAGYPVSNAYGLTNVPSTFLIGQDGKVQIASIGFSRADLEEIATKAAAFAARPPQPLFAAGEIVPDLKHG